MNWIKKYEDWSKQPLNYNFNRVFFLVSIIYFISTMFDFCLTFITFRLDSDGFFMYEISYVIKEALSGDPLFCSLVVILFMLPLIIVYCFNIYHVKHYGSSINSIRVLLVALYVASGLHIIGGWTNFFYLINLRV